MTPKTSNDILNEVSKKGVALSTLGVESVVIENDLSGREVELISQLDFGPNLAVVSDPETRAALGERVERALASKYKIQSVVLGSHPHPDEETLDKLCHAIAPGTDGVIAVGSGSINDLCKMAAHRKGISQAVFGTAPSMNGYTSVNAAITVGGLKKSLHAAAPRGVFLDLGMLSKAPKRLIQSGLGDSLCRPTAQADWLLAHHVWDQQYNEKPFELLAADEDALFSRAAALLAGDLEAMRNLARTLVLSGFGMTICGGSYPASQGEHLISHYIDMLGNGLPESFHGEQIGVTTLSMARLQETVLRQNRPPVLKPSTTAREDLIRELGPKLGESCWKEFKPKKLSREKAELLNARLEKDWDTLRTRLEGVTISSERLASVLMTAGAPTRPQDLGWPETLYQRALAQARWIRNRYTFLDFSADASVAAPAY